MAQDDDWRIRNQDSYLQGVRLHRTTFVSPTPSWDHEHCDFCWAKFMEVGVPGTLHEGYTHNMEFRQVWICDSCFSDFKERFAWTVIE
jgi:hypothetical protein